MTDDSQTPTTPTPPPPQGPGFQLPPVDPKALLDTALAVIKAPAEFFKSIKEEKGFARCLVFSVVACALTGVLMFLWWMVNHALGYGFGALFQWVVTGFLGPFVGGLIVWIISKVAGSTAPYEPSVRIAAYSYVVAPVAAACLFVPWIGWLAAVVVVLYGLFIAVTGAKVLNFEAPPPAPVPPA